MTNLQVTPQLTPDHVFVEVKDLREGWRVDLENDDYSGTCDEVGCEACYSQRVMYENEYSVVGDVFFETPDCVVVEFDSGAIGFPPDHKVKVDPLSFS